MDIRLRHILGILFMLLSLDILAQYETGSYQIFNYVPKEYKAHAQNFAVTQDSRGVMFFGNNQGVLEFDGSSWRYYKVTNESPVRSIAVDDIGRIFVGAEFEMGYFFPDSSGTMNYNSLIGLLNEEDEQNLGKIKKIHFLNDLVYFQGDRILYVYDGKTIEKSEFDSGIDFSFTANNNLYLYLEESGLINLTDNQKSIFHSQINSQKFISDFLNYQDRNIFVVPNEGFYELLPNDSIKFLFTLKNKELLQKVNKFSILEGGNYIIGTWGKGIYIVDKSGNILQKISERSGLQSATINDQLIDNHGVLWLALENGISKIDLHSPLSLIGKNHGLTSTVEFVTRHKGKLYLATGTGIAYLTPCTDPEISELPQITYCESTSTQTWGLLSFQYEKDTLLLFTDNDGVHELLESGKTNQIAKCWPWRIVQSKKYPDRVYVGLDYGIMVLKKVTNRWEEEIVLDDLKIGSRRVSEDEKGIIWLSSEQDGIARVELEEKNGTLSVKQLDYFNEEQGIPTGATTVHNGKFWNLVGTFKGLYRFNSVSQKFVPDTIIGALFNYTTDAFVRLSEDSYGNIWLVGLKEDDNSSHVSFVSSPNTMNEFVHKTAPFRELSDFTTFCLFHENNGISWLGGPDGVYRFDGAHVRNYTVDYHTVVRNVSVGKNKLIFGGAYLSEDSKVSVFQNEEQLPVIDYKDNSLTFEYTALSFEDETSNLYSYYLEGFSNEWTDWNSENKAIFTNLPEGSYIFKVKSINKFHHEGQEAQYHFSILPPWYRTWWAYLGYLLGFLAVVKGAIDISSRSLKAIIEEKTAEVVKQKEEIEAKNATLESANEEILMQKHVIEEKNKDIVDSINYAEKIQRAILPQEELRQRILPNSFVLFRPKDIVSGDFYWMSEKDNKAFFTAADCTGHGVPGAFMSMIGSSLLNETVNEQDITEPGKILDLVKAGVIKALKQGEQGESKDGMDAALCTIDHDNNLLEYAGANNPLYIVRKGNDPIINNAGKNLELTPYLEEDETGLKLYEIKADKMPLAYYPGTEHMSFTNHMIQLQSGDEVFVSSDGFPDQFGGPKGKKFLYKKFKKLLMSLYDVPMEEQRDQLEKTILKWMGSEHEQVDDICVIGVKI